MSIYENVGGAAAVRATVDDFYVRILGDPNLAPFFSEIDMHKLKSHQRRFTAAAVGGTERYVGRDMASVHAGLRIADADFDAVVNHLIDTLAGLGVPAEIIDQIGATVAPLRAEIVTEVVVKQPSAI